MVKVRVGRPGEVPTVFEDHRDVFSGAAREEIPWLRDIILPPGMVDTLVSGVERKFEDHINALRAKRYDLRIVHPSEVLQRMAFEDYKEGDKKQVDIAVNKLHVGFLDIFTSYREALSKKERKTFDQEICQRFGIPSIDYMLASSDDRNQILDHVFLDPLFGRFRDHPNAKVREIFGEQRSTSTGKDKPHDVPGKRVKEVFNAGYGVLNSIYDFQTVKRQLRFEGVEFDELSRMDTTLCCKSVVGSYIPEHGIVVSVEGVPGRFKEVTREDFKQAQYGHISDFDDHNLVERDDVPEGMSQKELRLRDPYHPYFQEEYAPVMARIALAACLQVPVAVQDKSRIIITDNPVAVKSRKNAKKTQKKKPKTVLPVSAIITAPATEKEVKQSVAVPKGMKRSKERGEINTLYDLERKTTSGQAFVVQDPDKIALPTNGSRVLDIDGNLVSESDVRLLRRLETGLIATYLSTMSTMTGAPAQFGRAHLVEREYFDKYGYWYGDLANIGLTGDARDEAYTLYDSAEALVTGLGNYDRLHYQHDVQPPKNDYVDEEFIKQLLGLDDFGLVVSGYGSASSLLAHAYNDPLELFYEVSKFAGLTVDGGGTDSAMLAMRMAVFKAIDEGYDVLSLGVRSMKDVSPLEGADIVKWIEEQGLKATVHKDPRHISCYDGRVNFLNLSRLLQRQDIIARLSHISLMFPGGKGTALEAMITAVNNARYRILGKGLVADRVIPLVQVDHKFNYGPDNRRLFDKLNECAFGEDMERLGVFNFTDKRDALDLIKQYASGNQIICDQRIQFDVEPRRVRGYVQGADLSPSGVA